PDAHRGPARSSWPSSQTPPHASQGINSSAAPRESAANREARIARVRAPIMEPPPDRVSLSTTCYTLSRMLSASPTSLDAMARTDLLGVPEIAELLGVDRRTVWRYVQRNDWPAT